MNDFIVSAAAVLPLFILIGVGVLVGKIRLVTYEELLSFNKLVFRVFFPFMMFFNIYDADYSQAVKPRLIIFAVISIFIVYALTVVSVLKIEKENFRRGAMMQAIFRSNFVLMGLPVVENLYGGESIASTAMVITVIVPIYNILAVTTLEMMRGGKVKIKKILFGIITNPLIVGSAVGIIAMLLKIRLPDVIVKPISQIAVASTPIALIILGATFRFESVKQSRRDLIIAVVSRLVIVPALGLTAAALMGFRGADFVTLIAMFSAPCAVSSFTMAQQMGSDGDLAANCVVFTSAFACFTMFLWIFLFKSIGII